MGEAARSRHRGRIAVSGISGASSGAASGDASDASGGGSGSVGVVAARVRAAREVADADAVASDPFLAQVLDRLQAAIRTVAGTRWSTRGPGVLAAALRALARVQARLD